MSEQYVKFVRWSVFIWAMGILATIIVALFGVFISLMNDLSSVMSDISAIKTDISWIKLSIEEGRHISKF